MTQGLDLYSYRTGCIIGKLEPLFNSRDDVDEWLDSHESGLPKTPREYLESGQFDIVEKLIGLIEYGAFS